MVYLPAQHFKQHILYLASDSLHGRAPGSVDEQKAANYIALEFDSANCNRVMRQNFAFEKGSATNIFGFLDFKKDSTIIMSAHYDHLGYGSNKSKEIKRKGIHHGADDNASGVAMVIELAKLLGDNMSKGQYNFLFAAYSAHEAGLFGSDYFSKSKICEPLKIRAVINFDMVGRLNTLSKTLHISGAETDPVFHTFFQQYQDSVFHFRFDDTNIRLSDLKPFAQKGIPVLNVTTGVHDDYHRISDTENKINYSGMKSIFIALQSLIKNLAKK